MQQQAFNQPTVEEQNEAQRQIRGVYDDGFADINGRRYTFHKMRHLDRREVFAFFTTIKDQLFREEFGFMRGADFAKVEQLILRSVSCDGLILDKAGDWWDQHPEDYLLWVSTSLAVTSYPFLAGARTASTSGAPSPTGATRLRKPMSGQE